MAFNPAHVLSLLVKKFEVQFTDDPLTTREERKVANLIMNILENAVKHDFEVETADMMVDEDDHANYEVEEFQVRKYKNYSYDPRFQPYDDFVLPSHRDIQFGDKVVSRGEAQKAIGYYRNTDKGSRSLASMKHAFRWIKTKHHLEKLRKYETERLDFQESRTNLLKVLSKRLFEVVKDKLENGKMNQHLQKYFQPFQAFIFTTPTYK